MKPKRAKAVRVPMIEWKPDCRLGVGFVPDRYNPGLDRPDGVIETTPGMKFWLENIEIGLRFDGVVMWRKAKELKR